MLDLFIRRIRMLLPFKRILVSMMYGKCFPKEETNSSVVEGSEPINFLCM